MTMFKNIEVVRNKVMRGQGALRKTVVERKEMNVTDVSAMEGLCDEITFGEVMELASGGEKQRAVVEKMLPGWLRGQRKNEVIWTIRGDDDMEFVRDYADGECERAKAVAVRLTEVVIGTSAVLLDCCLAEEGGRLCEVWALSLLSNEAKVSGGRMEGQIMVWREVRTAVGEVEGWERGVELLGQFDLCEEGLGAAEGVVVDKMEKFAEVGRNVGAVEL